jgi:RNA polymerase sigma factor (sigma-70 family)
VKTRTPSYLATRKSLLSRIKDWDDQESWKDFFDTYWKLIYNAAIKSGLNDAEAQDVVQETVVTIARRIGELKYDPALGSFKGWLLNTTRWKINDQFRKRAPRGRAATGTGADAVARLPDPAQSPLDALWEQEWEQTILDAALARVKQQASPAQYQIFDLYVVKGWPARKVAQTLGVTAMQVYLAKHRVSALLKKEAGRIQRSDFG